MFPCTVSVHGRHVRESRSASSHIPGSDPPLLRRRSVHPAWGSGNMDSPLPARSRSFCAPAARRMATLAARGSLFGLASAGALSRPASDIWTPDLLFRSGKSPRRMRACGPARRSRRGRRRDCAAPAAAGSLTIGSARNRVPTRRVMANVSVKDAPRQRPRLGIDANQRARA